MVGCNGEWQGGQLTKRLVGQMTVGQCVYTQNHTQEVDVHARIVTAYTTTTPLMKMGPEGMVQAWVGQNSYT